MPTRRLRWPACARAAAAAARVVLVAMLCAAFLATPALAQPEPILDVHVGYGGFMRRDSYFPIRVNVGWPAQTIPGNPGEAEAARVEVLVPQDDFYSALITRDVTVQQGVASSVVVYARSRGPVDEVEVTLRDHRGRAMARTKISSSGLPGWSIVEHEQALVLAVGRTTLARSGWVFDYPSLSPVKVAALPPEQLPRQWTGYDSVSLVVLEDLGAGRLDALQIQTLLQWVAQGGDLAVTVTDRLDTFNNVLGDLNLPVRFGEYNSLPFDPGLEDVLRSAVSDAVAASSGSRASPSLMMPSRSALGWYNLYLPQLKSELTNFNGRYLYRRPMELLEQADEENWSARWAQDQYPPEDEPVAAPRSGDIVVGGWGLGTITLLGVDPASLAGADARELRGVGWYHCLAHIRDVNAAVTRQPVEDDSYSGYRIDSPLAMLYTDAANSVLDDLSSRFSVSNGLFGAIAMALLLLVVIIGPVDYFVLRRLRREPLTWITCPLAIVLACGAIYFAQESVSYGAARASRITIADSFAGNQRAMATSFTAVAPSRGGRYTLGGLPQGAYASPTCWMQTAWYYYASETHATTVAIDESGSGGRIRSMYVPLDNVRWMQDRGPIDIPPIAVTVRDDAGSVVVDVQAPADVKGRLSAVRWNGAWFAAGDVELVDGHLAGVRCKREEPSDALEQLRRRTAQPAPWAPSGARWQQAWTHDVEFQLSGHHRTTEFLDAHKAQYAAVLLTIDRRSGVELDREGSRVETEWQEELRLRLIVPVERSAGEVEGDGS